MAHLYFSMSKPKTTIGKLTQAQGISLFEGRSIFFVLGNFDLKGLNVPLDLPKPKPGKLLVLHLPHTKHQI